jgi:hypothetical protein
MRARGAGQIGRFRTSELAAPTFPPQSLFCYNGVLAKVSMQVGAWIARAVADWTSDASFEKSVVHAEVMTLVER